MAKFVCRIRKYRKSAQLSQQELALLVGLKSQGAFSEIESGLKRPSVSVAFASEIVFSVPTRELFPGLYGKTERSVRLNARLLHARLRFRGRRAVAVAKMAEITSRLAAADPPV